jgi:Flp pilus assembly protein TadD
MKSLRGKVYKGAAILLVRGAAVLAQSQPPAFETNWTNLNDLARFHVEETEYLLGQRDLDAASLELQQALSMVPDHPTLLRWAADLYTDRGQYAMAESYWARLSEVFPSNTWVFLRWGDVLFQINRFDQAENVLNRALELEPGDLSARYRLACLQLVAGRREPAQTLLRNLNPAEIIDLATRVRQESELLLDKLGNESFSDLCRLILGDLQTEAPETGAAAPTDTESWTGRMERVTVALTAMAEGLRTPEARRDHALALYRLGHQDQALEEFARLNQNNPDLPDVQRTYGQLLLQEHRFARAAQTLERARRRNPEDVEAVFALICAYAAQSQYTDAREAARALPPEQAARISAWLREGHPYREYLGGNAELLDWLQSLGQKSSED